jgi:molybdopterin-binding protein
LPGTVRKIESIDGEAMLTVLAGDEFFVRVTSSAVTRLGLAEGSAVVLIIKTRSFRVL